MRSRVALSVIDRVDGGLPIVGVVRLRGELQLCADRLDPELVFVFVDVADGQR
jgi:hypothetical protein